MQTRLVSVLLLAVATPALAEGRRGRPGVHEDDIVATAEIRESVEDGALMPWSIGSRHARRGMLIKAFGGFDAAKDAPVMTSALEATLIERLTFRATATNASMSDRLRPGFGVLFDVTRREESGLDLAVGGDYELTGWNNYQALVSRVAAGSTVGLTRVQANAAFALSTDGGERYGDLRLSGLHPLAEGLYAGLDSRARVDLERDHDEPSGELDWDMQAGPIATLAVGRFAVSATGGVSAWKQRSRDTARLGAVGALGVGAVF